MPDRPDWWTPEHEQAALAGIRDQRNGMALDDRRQRARETGWDAADGTRASIELGTAIDSAVETATRVRITPEIMAAVRAERSIHLADKLTAAFRAAGFEVENG